MALGSNGLLKMICITPSKEYDLKQLWKNALSGEGSVAYKALRIIFIDPNYINRQTD